MQFRHKFARPNESKRKRGQATAWSKLTVSTVTNVPLSRLQNVKPLQSLVCHACHVSLSRLITPPPRGKKSDRNTLTHHPRFDWPISRNPSISRSIPFQTMTSMNALNRGAIFSQFVRTASALSCGSCFSWFSIPTFLAFATFCGIPADSPARSGISVDWCGFVVHPLLPSPLRSLRSFVAKSPAPLCVPCPSSLAKLRRVDVLCG